MDYIQSMLQQGHSEAQIKDALIKAGYSEDDTSQALILTGATQAVQEMQPAAPEKYNYFQRLGTALFKPKTFFANIQDEQGISEALLFLIQTSLITGILAAAGIIIALTMALNFLQSLFPAASALAGQSLLFIAPFIVIAISITIFAASFIGAGILQITAHLLGGQGRFDASYKIVAYSSAVFIPAVFIGFIPGVGQIAIGAWSLIITILGISILHQVTKKRAFAIAILPSIAVGVIGLAISVILGLQVITPVSPPQTIPSTQIVTPTAPRQEITPVSPPQTPITLTAPQTSECAEVNGQWCYSTIVEGGTSQGCSDTKENCADMLYTDLASTKNDLTECDNIADTSKKSSCIGTVAGQQKNKAACDAAPSKDDCYGSYAIISKDSSACDLINDQNAKQACAFLATPPPPVPEAQTVSNETAQCVKEIREYGPAWCYSKSDGSSSCGPKDVCLADWAADTKDPTICNQAAADQQNNCYANMASTTKTPAYCDQAPSPTDCRNTYNSMTP